jgi:hypothetical protein
MSVIQYQKKQHKEKKEKKKYVKYTKKRIRSSRHCFRKQIILETKSNFFISWLTIKVIDNPQTVETSFCFD